MFDFIKKNFSKKPWAKYDIDLDGKTILVDSNDAFKKLQQEKLDSKKKTEPKLNIVHSGIESDGKIKLELDWNDAFIELLRDNGFKGHDEEAIVQQYLVSISNDVIDDSGIFVEGETSIVGQEIPQKRTRKKKIQ